MVNKQNSHHASGHQINGRVARDPKARWRKPSPQEVLIFRTAVDECALRLVTDTDAHYEAMRQRLIDQGGMPPSRRAFVKAVLEARHGYGPRLLHEAILRRRQQSLATVPRAVKSDAPSDPPAPRAARTLT